MVQLHSLVKNEPEVLFALVLRSDGDLKPCLNGWVTTNKQLFAHNCSPSISSFQKPIRNETLMLWSKIVESQVVVFQLMMTINLLPKIVWLRPTQRMMRCTQGHDDGGVNLWMQEGWLVSTMCSPHKWVWMHCCSIRFCAFYTIFCHLSTPKHQDQWGCVSGNWCDCVKIQMTKVEHKKCDTGRIWGMEQPTISQTLSGLKCSYLKPKDKWSTKTYLNRTMRVQIKLQMNGHLSAGSRSARAGTSTSNT